MQRESGRIDLVIGRTGSGKTEYVIRRVYYDNPQRVIVWDPAAQFCLEDGFQEVTDLDELDRLTEGNTGPLRVAFVPNQYNQLQDQFEQFCGLAYLWCMEAPCWIIVEELADVTHAGKAPAGWGVIIRTIRKYGGHVWALTQRPAEIDKTILGNQYMTHIHAPSAERDRIYVAREIGIAIEEIPRDDFKFVQRYRDGSLIKGELAPP